MKLRTLALSVVVLAIISAIVYVAQRPGPPPSKDARVGQPLADRAVIEKAAQLQITDAGKTVTLSRQPDGSWKDTSYYDLPADFSKLSTFVGNLTDAKVERFVTANPERLDRLEFKDTKIALFDGAKKTVWSVTLGKNAETGGGRFLKFDDEPKAYLASLNAWIDSDPKNWANPELLAVKPDDLAKVEIEFPAVPPGATSGPATPARTITLTRAKPGAPWTSPDAPPHDQVKADRVSSLLSSIDDIRFTDTNDLTDPNVTAAKTHEREFKLTTFDGKTYTVAMGRKPEEKKLKPPTDGKTGPTALGSVEDLAKKEAKQPDKKAESKPVAPAYETIPAGPVFVFIKCSDSALPINGLMQKRAFQIGDYVFTSLPQKPDELFEPAPTPPAAKPAEKKSAPEKPIIPAESGPAKK